MAWDYEKVQKSLKKDYVRVIADIDQMKLKMRHEPHRFHYQGFIDKQNGALGALVLILSTDALTSPMILLVFLDDMAQNFYEYMDDFIKQDGVSESDIRAGYIEKINEIRDVANSSKV